MQGAGCRVQGGDGPAAAVTSESARAANGAGMACVGVSGFGIRLNARRAFDRYSSQFKSNCFTEMGSGSEAGSFSRLIDFCITQL